MKKIFNAILIVVLSLIMAYFLVPVYAEEGTEEVVIVDVRQNNNVLEHTGNTYQITDYRYNPLVLFYVKNAKKNTYYNVYFYINEEDYSLINVYNKSSGIEYYYNTLNLYNTNSVYNIKLCLSDGPESKTCTEEIASTSLTLNYNDYNKLSFDDKSFVVTKVMQGEEEITPVLEDNTYHYNITGFEEVKVSLKGTNFDNTLTYAIDKNGDKIYYSGSLINDGITISSYPVSESYLNLEAIFDINNKHLVVKKENDEELYNVSFDYNMSQSNLRFTVTPSVTHIDPISYRDNKVINFNLITRNLEDRDYKVRVYLGYLDSQNNNSIFYSEEKTLNGLDMNSGYNYTIEDVTLVEPTEAIDISACLILVEIEGTVKGDSFFFKADGLIHAQNVYYGDHETYLKEISGMGYPVMGKASYSLDMIREDIDKIYIQYGNASEMLEDEWLAFDDNKEYTYKLTRGYPKAYSSYADLLYEETLATGTVSGSDINANDFTLEIDLADPIFAQGFYDETYELTIYDDDVAVCYVQTQIKRNYGPTLADYELTSNNQELVPSGYNKYLIPNEYDLKINMIGLGFDEETEYILKMSQDIMGNITPYDPITVSGSDLNNGYLVTIPGNDDSAITSGSLSINVYDGEELVCFDYMNFTFYDKDKEEIQIISVKQDDTELVLENGKYVVNDPSKRITLEYKFKNIKPDRLYDYTFSTFGVNDIEYFDAVLDNSTVHAERLYINPSDIESGYTIHLCKNSEDNDCNKEITSKKIDFSLTDFEEYTYSNDKLLVTKVMQGGEEVLPVKEDGTYKYHLNDTQNIIVTVKGENLKSDANYYVGYTNIPQMTWDYFSGEDLMNGIDFVIPVKNNAYVYFEASLPIFPTLLGLEHRENEDISGVSFEFSHDENAPDYNFDVTYKDELACIQSMKGSVLVDPTTYNSKNGIDLLINGQNYLDENYAVSIRLLDRSGEETFNISFPVNGTDLNNGYRYHLSDISLALRESISDFTSGYYIIVNVDNASDQVQLLYNSSGSVNTKAFYSNNIEVIRDANNPYKISNYQVKYLDSNLINNNNEITLKYVSNDYDEFNDNLLYNYELIKGTMVYEYIHDLENKTIVDSGTVRGNVLNDVGVTKTINIANDFNENDAYMLVIKNGNEIVNYSIIQFRLTSEAMIIVNKLYDGDTELTNPYKSYEINYYHDTKLHLLGTNFDNDKTYTLRFNKYNNLSEENEITNVSVSGLVLNSGYDYTLDMVTDEEILFGGMNISILDDGGNQIDALSYSFSYVEKYHPTIKINTVKQDNKLLTVDNNGNYIVPDFAWLDVDYEVENYDPTREYYYQVFGGTSNGTSVNHYNSEYHVYPVSFRRDQIEGEYTETPICPVLNEYTLTGQNDGICSYEKTTLSYSNPTCPEVDGFDFVLRDGDVCNYQREYQVPIGEHYTPPICDECEGTWTTEYETQYEYATRDAVCAEGELNNGVCVITTVKQTTRNLVCINGSLEGDKCKLDTSNGYFGTYAFVVCADSECERQLDWVEFDVKYEMPELVNQSKLYVEKVMQSGIEIAPEINGSYAVNNLETIEVTVQGENLVADKKYYVDSYYDPLVVYTGSELNEGVTFKIYGGNDWVNLNLYNDRYGEPIVYAMDHNDEYVSLSYRTISNVPDFTYELSYFNHQDKEIITTTANENETRYYLNSNYFNSTNPLKIRITSPDLDPNGDYNVNVSIAKDGENYYQNAVNIKGNRLISGYEYFINNLDLDFVTEVGENIYYNLLIEVNSVSHQTKFIYNSIGNDPGIMDYVFYKNDKEHLQTAKGSGGYSFGGPVYTVSDRLFTDHNSVYIKYVPRNNYQDDVTYSYTLEYFENEGLRNIEDRVAIVMKTGTVSGLDFNKYGLTLEISNPNNYTTPAYGLTIKNGDEVLYMGLPRLELKPIATLMSIRVMANNTDATYNSKTDRYSIPRDRGVYGIISGVGFDDDKEYTINVGKNYYVEGGTEASLHTNEYVTLSGYDLNRDGVRFMLDNNVSEQYTYASYGSDYNMGDDIYFRDAIYIDYREPDPEVGEYSAYISYHNNNEEVYYVEPSLFNNDGLDVVISGEGFHDKKYPVSVRIMHGETVVYNETIDVEGLALNDGYNLYLEDLELELVTMIPDFEYAGYNVDVIINGIRKNYFFTYNSRGEVTPHVYYNTTPKEAKAVMGSSEAFFDGRRIKLNRHKLNDNNQLTIKYQGYKFDNKKNYTFEFIHDTNNGGAFSELFNHSTLDQGTISGAKLNNEGLIKKISINPNTFDYYDEYVLIIRSGEEIVYYSRLSFSMVDTPMITNYDILVDQNVITKNRDTYLLNYHTEATTMLNGIDFELNKDYRISIDEHYEDYCDVDDNCVPRILEYVVKGSKLNDGFDYKITVNDNEEIEYKYISITVTDIATDEEIDWTTIYIKYATPVYFFDEGTTYTVDDDLSVIKDVKKETDFEEFIDNISTFTGISVKLFDSMGEHEITSNIVGTGMLLKVLDEDSYEDYSFPIVIKGDISGDGRISISDIIRVKKHLINIDVLTGIYEAAGDVTNTGSISATDLVNMARDLAHIEELD